MMRAVSSRRVLSPSWFAHCERKTYEVEAMMRTLAAFQIARAPLT